MLSLNPEAVEFVPTPIIASSDDYDQYDPWYNPVPYAQQKFGGKKKKKKHAKQKRAELSASEAGVTLLTGYGAEDDSNGQYQDQGSSKHRPKGQKSGYRNRKWSKSFNNRKNYNNLQVGTGLHHYQQPVYANTDSYLYNYTLQAPNLYDSVYVLPSDPASAAAAAAAPGQPQVSDDLYKTISNASTSTTSDGVAMTAGATAPSQGQQAGVVPEQQMWFQPFHSSRYDAQSRAILAAEIAQRMHTSYHATNNGAFASPDEHGFIHPKQPPSLVAIAVSVARDAIVQVERGELLVQAQGWDIGMLWCMVTGLGKKRVGDGKEDVKSRSRERLSEMVSLDAWNMGLRIVQGKSLRDVAREVGGMSEAQLLEFCAVGADQMPGQVQGGVHGQAMQGDWYAATSPGIARSDNGVGETWGNGPGPAVVGGSEDGQGWNTS